jgi:hypothetical protein
MSSLGARVVQAVEIVPFVPFPVGGGGWSGQRWSNKRTARLGCLDPGLQPRSGRPTRRRKAGFLGGHPC